MNTLIIPSVRKKNGTGHLKRSLILAEKLRVRDEISFFLNLPSREFDQLIEKFPSLRRYSLHRERKLLPPDIDRIILDNRSTSYEDFLKWEKIAPVILIDEGGEARMYGSFLVDSLPSLNREPANVRGDALFSEGELKTRERGDKPSLLITFGGEDPQGLTEPVLEILAERGGDSFSRIGVVQGPLSRDIHPPEGISLYRNPPGLDSLLGEYDTVITSFGLTPYEAKRAGCAVALINPGSYHERLSKLAGFYSLGSGAAALRKLRNNLDKIRSLPPEEVNGAGKKTVPAIIERLHSRTNSLCPLCGKEKNRVLKRFEDRTFYYCGGCRNYYLVNWQAEEEVYDREYFFGRYKAQYGKTYLEDFENIKRTGISRMENIISLQDRGRDRPRLVDLGCAFGPFLAAATESGYEGEGVEINADGAEWVEENLRLPVYRGSLEEGETFDLLARNPYDAVTLWYVIEHLPGQQKLLSELNRILKGGGVLAFGTPSGRGVSARRNLSRFLEKSPPDHFVIYTPGGVKRILSAAGFSRVIVKSVGHHPERFGKWVGKKGSFTYNAMMALSRALFLGDSLEAYALKGEIKESSL